MNNSTLPFKLSEKGKQHLEKSLEEKENPQVIDVESSEYQIMEREDETQIIAAMQGELIENYVYSFEHQGRRVVGLSWAGVKEAARHMGDIDTELISVEETEEAFRMVVKATDKATGNSRLGASQQKKHYKTGVEDDFAYVKCLSKAQRNAIRALLPEQVIAKTIEGYLVSKSKLKKK